MLEEHSGTDTIIKRIIQVCHAKTAVIRPTPRVGESFFDYEYLREFEAKIGTARMVV
jgi:hypothetical protein